MRLDIENMGLDLTWRIWVQTYGEYMENMGLDLTRRI